MASARPKKKRCVFFAEIEQAPVGADGGQRVTNRLLRIRAWRLTVHGSDERVQQDRIVDTSAEIDPGELTQKSQRRFCAGEQNGNNGKALAAALGDHLALQREILLPLLPRPHLSLADADRHRPTTRKGLLQRLRP